MNPDNKTEIIQQWLTYEIITTDTSTIHTTEAMMEGFQIATNDFEAITIHTYKEVPEKVTNWSTD